MAVCYEEAVVCGHCKLISCTCQKKFLFRWSNVIDQIWTANADGTSSAHKSVFDWSYTFHESTDAPSILAHSRAPGMVAICGGFMCKIQERALRCVTSLVVSNDTRWLAAKS